MTAYSKLNYLKKVSILLSLTFYMFSSNPLSAQSDSIETRYLTTKTGKWSVTMTARPTPGSPAQTVKGITAERSMVGTHCLHEVMQPAPGSKVPGFTRVSDLAYNQNESRWNYTSIDTRFTIGIMFFTNYSSKYDTIISYTDYFPSPGFSPDKEDKGKAFRGRNLIINRSDNVQIVQLFMQNADGKEWLAVQYEYTRQK